MFSLTQRLSTGPRLGQTQKKSTAARVVASLMRWDARFKERAHLENLSDRELADVGLTRADVARGFEGRWDAPSQFR